jgi:tetratricopeptide (TPR) repeat protein
MVTVMPPIDGPEPEPGSTSARSSSDDEGPEESPAQGPASAPAPSGPGTPPAPNPTPVATPPGSGIAVVTWPDLNEGLADGWHRQKRRNWLVFILIFGVFWLLDVSANWIAVKPDAPCWLRGEQEISEPYGIVVANVAVRAGGEERPTHETYENARHINNTLYRQVSSEFSQSPTVGVSRTCDDAIHSGIRRADYLSETREKLKGDLAVSFTLVPDGRRFEVEIEIDIGSRERWYESQELAGYYTFSGVLVGAALEVKDSVADSSVAELINPYINMLKAVADYARSDYESTISILDEIVTAPAPTALKQLAWVLLGNSEGRLGKPGALDRAEAAYGKVLEIGDGYPRATLGLAEIDYQRGLLLIKEREGKPQCDGTPTEAALTRFDSAYKKYMTVFAHANVASVPDMDVRAKFGTGRIHACMFRLGYKERSSSALADLAYVTRRFMSDTSKLWLQSPASGAFGDRALVFCGLKQRDKALASYASAIDWAMDKKRVDEYRKHVDLIRADSEACS